MTLEQLVQTVEGKVYRLGKRLWRDEPLADLRAEADQLSEELQHGYSVLESSHAQREAVSHRLADEEYNAAMLVSRIETYVHVNDAVNAWHSALELDYIRRSIRQDRARLRFHEETCRKQRAQVREVEGRLAGLLEKLYPR
jgi:hypothetical protein